MTRELIGINKDSAAVTDLGAYGDPPIKAVGRDKNIENDGIHDIRNVIPAGATVLNISTDRSSKETAMGVDGARAVRATVRLRKYGNLEFGQFCRQVHHSKM